MATTGQDDPAPILSDPAALRVLSTIYRARPATRQGLAAFESLPLDQLPDILAALHGSGLIVLDGDRIDVPSPDRVIAELTNRTVGLEQKRLAELATATTVLARLTRDWELGSVGDIGSSWFEIIHGHEAQWQAWARYGRTHPPRRPVNIYPDLDILKSVILPSLTAEERALIARGVRIICPASVLAVPDDVRALDAITAAGGQVRIVDTVPCWVYADAGLLCGLPVTWGEHPPSSIMIVQQPAIVAAISLLVESYWDRGIDYPAADQSWRPVLQLLARGMPDASIAETLDLSLRTVQRRITEAMDQYSARSRFELGVAWARHGGGA
jgi:hypothetical protein